MSDWRSRATVVSGGTSGKRTLTPDSQEVSPVFNPDGTQDYSFPSDAQLVVDRMPDGTPIQKASDWKSRATPTVKDDKTPAPGIGKTALDQGLQGATFGFSDEITDRLGSILGPMLPGGDILADSSYTDRLKNARETTKQDLANELKEHPLISVGAQLGGGLLTGGAIKNAVGAVPKAKMVADLLRSSEVAKDAGFGAKAANLGLNMAKSGVVGATSGGLYGAGTADDGNRATGAERGAIMGGALGTAMPAVTAGIKLGAGAAKDAFEPFTDAGKQKIIGRLLRDQARNPDSLNKLDNIPEYLPGSPTTTAQGTGDYGWLGLERALSNTDQKPEFADVMSKQNAARNEAIQGIAGTPEQLEAARISRANVTAPIYEAAENTLVNKGVVDPVLKEIDAKVAKLGPESEAGKTLLGIKRQIQAGLPSSEKVGVDASGFPTVEREAEETLLGPQMQLYKETRDRLAKKAMQEGAYPAAVRGVVKPVHKMMGQALEETSPELKSANALYRQKSAPINQMETLQELQAGIRTAATDPQTGHYQLSAPKLTNMIAKPEARELLGKVLTKDQMATLDNVLADMQRSASVNGPYVKAAGSDTVQNLAVGNLMKNALGDTMANSTWGRTAARPLNWIYKVPNEDLKQMLLAAMLNPQTAKQFIGAAQKPGMQVPRLPNAAGLPTGNFGNIMARALLGQ